jgi:Fic family protein
VHFIFVFALVFSIITVEVQNMATKTEKLFYTLGEDKFNNNLKSVKAESSTLVFYKGTERECFYAFSPATQERSLIFEKALWELDASYSKFGDFVQGQIIQSLLIQEMQSTNQIEGVHSTRHDIFSLMQKVKATASSKKLVSMVNAYSLLLSGDLKEPSTLADIRGIYDLLLRGAIDKEDAPDGRFFRKDEVSVVGSTAIIHNGLTGEGNIEKAMGVFLDTYHSGRLSFLERILLSHYLLESVHPYYDGNGRLGRFLMSVALKCEKGSIFAFLVSSAIAERKNAYYKAFKDAEAIHNFGDLSAFVDPMTTLLITRAQSFKDSLTQKRAEESSLIEKARKFGFSKAEMKIITIIAEGSLWSDYGVTNKEIIENAGISKRALLYAIKKLRGLSLLKETKFGAFTYHKFSDEFLKKK